jgi:hypothetical protein
MTVVESISVPNPHSEADYLLLSMVLHFWVPRRLRRQAPYKFKKSYGGGFVWRLPIVSTLVTSKPTIFQ